MSEQSDKRQIEYVPPELQILRDYARTVCETLAERRDDPTLADAEIISGLAHFLEVITRIHARYLSTDRVDDPMDDSENFSA